MHYLTISFTHKNSTLEIRERLAFSHNDEKHHCLSGLIAHDDLQEIILLSTCNRMEIFCYTLDVAKATNAIFTHLSHRAQISVEELEGRADIFDNQSAIHHLFAVTASLDSLVIGETQIVGQLRDAYRFSLENKYCAKELSRAMKHAFDCASEIRSVTDISSKPVSIASVAVQKAKDVMANFQEAKALIIGSGEMSLLCAKYLTSKGVDIAVINRTRSKAQLIVDECGGKVLDYANLSSAVNEYNLLFTATSSPLPIIEDNIINPCDFDRYWFDLAIPRDIEFEHGERIHLYQIDDLKSIATTNVAQREEEAKASYSIIGRYTKHYFDSLVSLGVEPLIKAMYQSAQVAADAETARVLEAGYIPNEYKKEIQKLSEQTLKRFLHDISLKIRHSNEDGKTDEMVAMLDYIFNEEGK